VLKRLYARVCALAGRRDVSGIILARDIFALTFGVAAAGWAASLWVLRLDPRLAFFAVLQPRALIFVFIGGLMFAALVLWRNSLRAAETHFRSAASLGIPLFLIVIIALTPGSAARQLGPGAKTALFQAIIEHACTGEYEEALEGTRLILNSPRLDYFRSDAERFSSYLTATNLVRQDAERRAADQQSRLPFDVLVTKSFLFGDKAQSATINRFNRQLRAGGFSPVRFGRCAPAVPPSA